jgi:hypothetical protein
MKPSTTVAGIAKDLRLSAWLFGIFAVLSAAIAILDFLVTRRVEGGWPVAASVVTSHLHLAGSRSARCGKTRTSGATKALKQRAKA